MSATPVAGSPLAGWGTTLKELASRWTAYTAFGSFVLYLLGYLALRFHLTVLGVGTDLSVLDERYLFTGARFLVYWASSIPIAVVMLAVLAAPAYGVYRVLPIGARLRLRGWWHRLLDEPGRLTAIGIVLSVALIQLVMRQFFQLGNVLVGSGVPRDSWLIATLLDHPELLPPFFSALVAGTALVAAISVAAARAAGTGQKLTPGRGLLLVLLAIQALLLPVNFGELIVDKSLPRVAAMGSEPLAHGDQAWLVWEGKDGITFLLRRQHGERSLVTLPRQDSKRIEIQGYDFWMSVLGSEGSAR